MRETTVSYITVASSDLCNKSLLMLFVSSLRDVLH